MSNVKISALPVGVATSSTPFPAIVAGVTDQVTLEPVYTSLAGKAALSHTHTESDVTNLVSDLAALQSGNPSRTAIVASQFAWDNQDTSTVVDANGISYLTASPGSGTNRRVRLKTQPSTPYTITVGVLPRIKLINGYDCGISFIESATQKHASIGVFGFNTGLRAIRGTADNNYTLAMASVDTLSMASPIWLRLSNDATTLRFLYSNDGFNFTELFNEAVTASFTVTPNQVGYYVNNEETITSFSASFVSWVEA